MPPPQVKPLGAPLITCHGVHERCGTSHVLRGCSLTVLDNITLASRTVRRWSVRDAPEKAIYFWRTGSMPEQAHEYPGALAGGQQQWAAIARALTTEPQVMLCDEPTSALGPEVIGDVLNVIVHLAREGTTVVVTHEMGCAREMGDRVGCMDHGAILEEDTPKQFFTRPRHECLPAFLSTLL